jgi:hypothetical protein
LSHSEFAPLVVMNLLTNGKATRAQRFKKIGELMISCDSALNE